MVSNSDSSYSLSMQLKAWGTPRGGRELCYAGERFFLKPGIDVDLIIKPHLTDIIASL